ncbi:hypothetical protein Nepgr_014880 [Nepenthes gracilis]|uniref:Uncharacterized protein n=1 Tax=Nepenthes gracilis TaxID=150966 RepID=A0AAD3SLX8_NEPGR|nr:hypothetical protein Nepgr_014880 [Nepenthes gracilis]
MICQYWLGYDDNQSRNNGRYLWVLLTPAQSQLPNPREAEEKPRYSEPYLQKRRLNFYKASSKSFENEKQQGNGDLSS